jgi:hypothetical protein
MKELHIITLVNVSKERITYNYIGKRVFKERITYNYYW